MADDTKEQVGIAHDKGKEFTEWYPQVVLRAELADYSPVKGCMVIRPNGYAIWEKIQAYFNARLQRLGVRNAYFPLFIPESFFTREAEHAEGFSPEVAWIANTEDGERLAVRPTSETIMYDMYGKWIRSHRDLPLRLNQWANVVRWETSATKLFLRTREFLWQEGHCVYETKKEADKETILMLDEYKKMCEDLLAIPVVHGTKTEKEKFAGALYTTTIEALMPDGKALQMGTSHNLGQGFAKAFNIRFLGTDEKMHTGWNTSWGVSTRLIGAVTMVHGDNNGLVLPPKLAFNKAVIVPILFDKTKKAVLEQAKKLQSQLKDYNVLLDDRDTYKPGWKFNEWEMKGIPVRIELGPKDLEKEQVMVVRRDTGDKEAITWKDLKKKLGQLLDTIQDDLFSKAQKQLEGNIVTAKSWKEVEKAVKDKKMVYCQFCGDTECEDIFKDKTGGFTSRCIPFTQEKVAGNCVLCEKEAKHWIYFAKAY